MSRKDVRAGNGTRVAIIEAALRKFSERSFVGATTADIAVEAGVSEKTVFDLFGDKKALYLAVRDSIRDSLVQTIITRLLGSEAGALDPEMISAVISSSNGMQFVADMLGSLDPGVLTNLFATDAGKALTDDLLATLNEKGGADWLAGQLDAGGDANVLRNVIFKTESKFEFTTDNGRFTIKIPWLEAAFSGATTTTPDLL